MAGAVIEVKYFNSFVLKKTNRNNLPVWNGSYGIPKDRGGFPVVDDVGQADNSWAIEESRIRGGFNNTSTDYGARAFLVEEDPQASIRPNSLIYSGIFNSRTGINNTNVFSTADDIVKSADPANGSIQKLYAEDTNLVIFQERKVSRALIDKDAIYAAEGGGAVTASNLVIGVIQPYAGKFGISKNPESFAVYGYHKYFADKENNVILRLSRSGIDEISAYGMRDFFRDKLNAVDTAEGLGEVKGIYDIYNGQYVVSMQQPISLVFKTVFETLCFDEKVLGWTSRFSYLPQSMFSIGANFYSVQDNASGNLNIWRHYDQRSNRGQFYGINSPSSVTFILNVDPVRSKNFKTIGYEGNSGWRMSSFVSDDTGKNQNLNNNIWGFNNDTTNSVFSYVEGEYVFNPANNLPVERSNYLAILGTNDPNLPRFYAGFDRKENVYVTNLVSSSLPMAGEIIFGNSISGIKAFYATGTLQTDNTTDYGGEKQLFSVTSTYTINNGY